MRIFARHPDAETLTRYAARTLDGDERLATGRHLERCTTCRETVKVLRQLTDLGAASVESQSQDDILTRVLDARAAGARALLPTAEPVPIRSRRLPLAAGAGVAAIIAVVYLFSIRNASAGSRTGTLTFEPAAPQPGQMVRVTYEPNAPLARFDSVILRARFRRPVDDAYNDGMSQSRVGVMHRSGGRFTLEFRLPDSVVFAVFAVESPGADIIDDKDQQLWDLVTVDQSGKPLFDALVQKQRDLMGRNWEEGLRTTRTLAALYPDDPEAGGMVPVFERWVLGEHIADSLLPGHRRRFAALQAAFGEKRELPAHVMAGMAHFAIALNDSVASHFWVSRLQTSFPDDPEVLFREENRLADQYIKTQKQPNGFYKVLETQPAYFQELESVWRRMEPTHDRELQPLAQNALGHAMNARDTAHLRIWAGRSYRLARDVPGWSDYLGKELLQYPTLRDTAEAWLRNGVHILADGRDADRRLWATVSVQREMNRSAAQPMLASLGKALIEDGHLDAGLDTLRLAASYGWNPEVLRSVAQALIARGDTAAALQSYARVVADPGTPIALKDSIRSIVSRDGNANWDLLVRNAAQEMRQSVLQRAAPRSLNGPFRVMTQSGTVRNLAEVVNNKVTVLMFWSPYCGFSLQPLHDLDLLNDRLASQGAQVVTIVDQPFSKDLEQTLRVQRAGRLSVFYDFRSDAHRAFSSFGTPDYYVLDSNGRVIFQHSSLEELPRQVAALLPSDSSTP
jgi:thiol-disulfide isomerase/thioredoxin